jgi:low temperature requirement protein LtrA
MTVDDEEEDSDEEEEEEKWYKKYGLLPPPRDLTSPKIKRRVTWSELFFDLVFVVTLARLSEFIEENDNNGKELLDFTLYVFLIWNVWHSASDYGTRYGSNDLANMIYFSFYMLAGVGMAMNLREGIVGESRRGFAGSCMTAYLFQSMIHLRIWYTPPNQKAKDYAIFSIVFTDIPLILLFGTLCVVEHLSDPCIWTLFTIAALNQQIVEIALILSPRLRERVNVPVHLEHFTERKSLMMIIVLGEAVDDLVPRLGEDDANLVLYVVFEREAREFK